MTVYDEYHLMSQIKRLETELAAIEATDRRLIEENDRLRAQIAEQRSWADTMLRKIEVLEAQLAAKEAEEWR